MTFHFYLFFHYLFFFYSCGGGQLQWQCCLCVSEVAGGSSGIELSDSSFIVGVLHKSSPSHIVGGWENAPELHRLPAPLALLFLA